MLPPPPDLDEELPEPIALRRLRLLVTTLLIVLIVGFVTIVVTLVIRLSADGVIGDVGQMAGPVGAEALILPEGEVISSVGQGAGTVLVVTRGVDGAETLRVFDATDGTQMSATPILRE